jgi:hypothetical protein
VRYTTELTEPVWFYLRGEEYSAQIDAFIQRAQDRLTEGINRFQSAAVTDKIIGMIIADAEQGVSTLADGVAGDPTRPKRAKRFRLRRR